MTHQPCLGTERVGASIGVTLFHLYLPGGRGGVRKLCLCRRWQNLDFEAIHLHPARHQPGIGMGRLAKRGRDTKDQNHKFHLTPAKKARN